MNRVTSQTWFIISEFENVFRNKIKQQKKIFTASQEFFVGNWGRVKRCSLGPLGYSHFSVLKGAGTQEHLQFVPIKMSTSFGTSPLLHLYFSYPKLFELFTILKRSTVFKAWVLFGAKEKWLHQQLLVQLTLMGECIDLKGGMSTSLFFFF